MAYNTPPIVFLALLIIAGSFLVPTNYLAFAHTFSSSESADFLSLIEQIKAETQLVAMNLENNNVTLAQQHAQKASALPDNFTISEIRERNNRLADSLVSKLGQLEANVTSLTSTSQEPMMVPPDVMQRIDESVMSLDDILAEAVTVRVESDQQNNATTWALVLADLVNTVLSDYGNATGSFDLTNMSNMAGMEGMEGMQMNNSDNMTMMMGTDDGQMQMSGSGMGDDRTMTMQANSSSSDSSSTSNMTATTRTTNIVDQAAYQSAQYISNNTILQLFAETLKPLTLSAIETSSNEGGNASTSTENATTTQEEQQQQTSTRNLTSSNIDELEARLMLLRDNIANGANPMEVMTTAHLQIHPLLMEMYGLTIAASQEVVGHSEHSNP